jgi:hypothetical protein
VANRIFDEKRRSLEKYVVDLFCEFDIGASGAATISRAKGVKSVTKTSTGVYAIVLSDLYNKLLNVSVIAKNTSTLPNAPFVFVSATPAVKTTGTIQITTCAASGGSGALAATEPASGNTYTMMISLSNSQAV